MRKTIVTLLAATAVGAAGLTAAPQPAHAVAWWVAPAIIGGAVVGVGVGAVAANSAPPAYAYEEPAGEVYVRPVCRIERSYWNGSWHRTRVCD